MSKKWRCSVCGYVHDGDSAPEKCPKCGAPAEKFVEIAEDAAKLIERSRFSNGLHMEAFTILADLAAVAESGIQDALDPNCVAAFTKMLEQTKIFRGIITAELAAHQSKGKWN